MPTYLPTPTTSPSFRRSISDNHQENSTRRFELGIDVNDVTQMASRRLQTSSHRDLRNVSCEYDDGLLILHGRLGSYCHKQCAQETVAGISGVNRVVNEIEVVDHQPGG